MRRAGYGTFRGIGLTAIEAHVRSGLSNGENSMLRCEDTCHGRVTTSNYLTALYSYAIWVSYNFVRAKTSYGEDGDRYHVPDAFLSTNSDGFFLEASFTFISYGL